MAAVHQRERTGEGKPVEVSQYESTVVILGAALLERSLQAPDLGGSEPPRPGNRDAEAVPHNVFRCRGEDAWCAIAVYNDDQWRALLAVEELASLRGDELATLDGCRQHEQEIDAAIEAWTVHWDKQALAEFLQERVAVQRGPLLGEHTYAVLHDLLGMSDDGLTEAIADGAAE